MFLTYSEYVSFGGTLNETDFDRINIRAEVTLNTHTFGRIKAPDKKVQRCIYDLIEVENQRDGGIQSVSNDGYSISYASSEQLEQNEADIIYKYFVDDDILYAGTDGAPDYEPIAPDGYNFLLDSNGRFVLVRKEENE